MVRSNLIITTPVNAMYHKSSPKGAHRVSSWMYESSCIMIPTWLAKRVIAIRDTEASEYVTIYNFSLCKLSW